ncbi:hypothetical protein EYS14_19785 [Alteromonadaceae bacterium M269]|nr:hypothetical protein EYS14_19785 [Alteromonadaceae bacterium M269]
MFKYIKLALFAVFFFVVGFLVAVVLSSLTLNEGIEKSKEQPVEFMLDLNNNHRYAYIDLGIMSVPILDLKNATVRVDEKGQKSIELFALYPIDYIVNVEKFVINDLATYYQGQGYGTDGKVNCDIYYDGLDGIVGAKITCI